MGGCRALAGALLVFVSLAASDAAPSGSRSVNKPAGEGREPMWNLGDLYSSPQAWTAARDRLRDEVQTLDRLKGTFGNSAKAMLAGLDE